MYIVWPNYWSSRWISVDNCTFLFPVFHNGGCTVYYYRKIYYKLFWLNNVECLILSAVNNCILLNIIVYDIFTSFHRQKNNSIHVQLHFTDYTNTVKCTKVAKICTGETNPEHVVEENLYYLFQLFTKVYFKVHYYRNIIHSFHSKTIEYANLSAVIMLELLQKN